MMQHKTEATNAHELFNETHQFKHHHSVGQTKESPTKHKEQADMVRWKGKHASYFVLTNPGMANKYRENKSTKPLDVVMRFEVYKGKPQGDGQYVKASTGELK